MIPTSIRAKATVTELVDADWIEAHLDDPLVRLVELDLTNADYEEGHIPGAVLWNAYTDLRDERYQPKPMESVERLVRASGIDRDTTVVFYGYAPALGFWLMKHLGHDDVRILDLDRTAWVGDGRPWNTDPVAVGATAYRMPHSRSDIRADRDMVVRSIGADHHTILDVRSGLEFSGERFWPSGGTPEGTSAGRVPSAMHLPADGLTDADGAFLPVGELAMMFSSSALDSDQTVTTYCTIGARAATVWFVLTYLLGHPHVRVYDGSWTEWGMDASNPVEAD